MVKKNMKRGLIALALLMSVFSIGLVSAVQCDLSVELINQNPYPAVPGEYVDVVFQINGVGNPECGVVNFEVIQEFPFSLDPYVSGVTSVKAGTYSKDFSSFLIAPYKIRVDKDALDGDSPLEVRYSKNSGRVDDVYIVKEFNINIADSRTDFEIFISNYNPITNTIDFDILNIGKNNIEALTIEIPKQDNIVMKGSNVNIVGSLDSNEDTSFSFLGVPKAGEIKLNVLYTDEINVRRTLEKTVTYEPEFFKSNGQSSGISIWVWIVLVVVLVGGFWYWRRRKAMKKKEMLKHHR